ncbi:MAG: nuclear transport factor 2 family protein [Acidobacteria bacterium]|nr:nuclear transport factor 2 family protein [Acidobacteriota bacterium]
MNENIELVQQAYGYFGSGNIDGLIGLLTEDVKWTIPEVEGSPMDAVTNGRENVREFFGTLASTEEFSAFEPREFIADGNKVVVLGHSAGKVIETGRTFSSDWVQVFTVENGKISVFHEFFDNAEVARAYQKAETA